MSIKLKQVYDIWVLNGVGETVYTRRMKVVRVDQWLSGGESGRMTCNVEMENDDEECLFISFPFEEGDLQA